ncbi:unnamed protein product, partial [Cochlearia groenlandica]
SYFKTKTWKLNTNPNENIYIFTSLTNLGFIGFSKNQLSGNFPPSFAKLSQKLVHLEVNQNNLSGTIPNYFSRFIELATLDLSNNHFSGV